MPKFRKKPVVIEASRWTKNGDHPEDYAGEVHGFADGEFKTWRGEEARSFEWEGQVVRYYRSPDAPGDRKCQHCGDIMHIHGWIETLEGGHIVCPGDWIITGVQGERYPCKPDIFEQTYEQVPDGPGPKLDIAERCEHHADAILRAAGSGLKHYSTEKTRRAILSAAIDAWEEAYRAGAARALEHFREHLMEADRG